ncbi:MAG: enoyl-CoA hydratase/isomerase family protein [Candidatus Limnocylindrales bacterium]
MSDEHSGRGEVRLECDEAIAHLHIDRPHKLNTFTATMSRQLVEHCAAIDRDEAVRAVVITAEGHRAFCAGSDVTLLDDLGTTWQGRNRAVYGRDYIGPLLHLRKPVVAAIRGYCLGGGLEIALASDIRIAGRSATFGAPEVKLGWHAGSGNTTVLPRLIGYGNAARWILTGDRFTAEEAHRVGLVQEVVDDQDVDSEAFALARRIAANPPLAVQSAKHLIGMSQGTSVEQGLAWENDLYTYCMTTDDSREGVAAFTEKREPRYRGS